MHRRLAISVEIDLGRGDMGGRLDVAGQLVVAHGVHELGSPCAVALRIVDRTRERARERQHPEGGGREGVLAERLRGLERALRELAHLLVLGAEEPVDRELDHERDRLRADRVGEMRERLLQARVRLPVAAEQVLDAGAGHREPHPQRDGLVRNEAERLEHVLVGELELPGCRERLRA